MAGDAWAEAEPGGTVDFLRDVRPILSSHCFQCHGPDEATRKAGLRLDLREEALRPVRSGYAALVPGDAGESELVLRVETENENDIMPPPSLKRPLTEAQKGILRRWVEQGAEYRPHWAFERPVRPAVPDVAGEEGRALSPIDAFVRERLVKEGLEPAPEADRATLVRRVFLDLIGLPPTPEEAAEYLEDRHPDAYERLVDRLLASPHYGERWARRWLDLARYSDTNGYEKDRVRSMWPWRDWVIRALNEDLPFDRFTVEQLAGDMLAGAGDGGGNGGTDLGPLIATGFHRNTMINEEGGIDPLEFRFYAMVDRVHTTATTWLGLTMSCAQCHTHKYDPFQHREYFSFMAFLDNADEPVLDVPQADLTRRRAEIDGRIAALTAGLADRFPLPETGPLVTPEMDSVTAGSPFERLPDGSHRFGGEAPERDTMVFEFRAGQGRVTRLNLDALADDGLPRKGPGRSESGNFVLSEIRMDVAPAGGGDWTGLSWGSASADFAQGGFPVGNAIDGKENTGWAVAGDGAWNINRRGTFLLAEPVNLEEGARVRVTLVQHFGGRHVLGRVRLSLGYEGSDARPEEERRREHLERRFLAWQEAEAGRVREWTVLTPLAATSAVPVLTIEADGTVFASSDQTKSDLYQVRVANPLRGVTAIRLEALADERLPRGGPGRVYYEGPVGDFFLSTLSVRAGEEPVALVSATQTHAAGGNTAARAIDDDPQSGWAIDGGQGRDQAAVFRLSEPIEEAGELEIGLLFERYFAAGLGRFRLSATADPRGAEAMAMPDALQRVLVKPDGDRTESERAALLAHYVLVAPELAPARREIERLRRERPAYPTTLVMAERPPENPRRTPMRHRGEFLEPRETVEAALPEVLAVGLERQPSNRLEFAQWLVSRENPLTARVTVNRQWQAFFGEGLVRTMEDFGFQGELPSHPGLLDWLAVEFMEDGWSLKRLKKRIVMSATYRQSSRVSPELLERDPSNGLLARGPRFRVEGELVRDLALRASGLLSPRMGGPSVFPPQLGSITREGTYGPLEWRTSEGEDRYRRGLYTFSKRTAPYAAFLAFDAPSGEACVARREVSNTPLQALTLLNDEVFVEAAQALGSRAAALAGSDEERVAYLFRRCLTRPPESDELERVLAFYRIQRERLDRGELEAEVLAGPGDADLVERAAWTAVARALLNLDETVTRG